MFDLPDLTGQPPWVIVVVVALFVAGSVGVAWVRRSSPVGDGEEEPESEQIESARPPAAEQVPSSSVAVSSPDTSVALVLKQALDHLAREASESQFARDETAQYRRENERLKEELVQCGRERETAMREWERARLRLDQCNERCARLADKALDRGAIVDDNG